MKKKPTLTAALAVKKVPPAAPIADTVSANPPESPSEARINTTLRLPPETLLELKILAAQRRVRVNDLVLQGIAHVLELHGRKSAA